MDRAEPPAELDAYTDYMMLADLSAYLADDILVKVDRASMAVSLETRAPLLDHRLVEFAASLPLEFKLTGVTGKRILKDIAHRHIPQRLLDRPKVGFAVPIDSWLRTGLAEWAEELLSPQRLRNDGYFDVAAVRKIWEQHKSGSADWHYWLWDVLMFQSWLDRQPAMEAGAPERVPQLLVS
jgi:asparagine synthase (glutamine-hydrolysing)